MNDEFQPGYPVDLRSDDMRARAARDPYGDFEAKAARVVARATGLQVVIQDDNRTQRQPDLRIETDGVELGQVEVVMTARPERAQQLRAFAAGDLQFDDDRLTSTWWITVTGRAKRKGMEQLLISSFAELEARGEHQQINALVSPERRLAIPEIARLDQLGFTEAHCDPTPRDGPGRINGLPQGIEGPPGTDWLACQEWLEGFLRSDRAQSKIAKLVAAGSGERHLYIGATGADPWPVHQVLQDRAVEVLLPQIDLPDGLTHLWLVAAEFPGRVIAWWPDRGWFDPRTCWATA